MGRFGTACFSIARLLAITASLLFAAFAASASSYDARTPIQSEHGIGHDRRVGVVSDTLEHHDSPAEQPLHCHFKSPHPEESGRAPTSINGVPSLLMSQEISAPALATEMHFPAVWAHIPILAPPRFILFGNFRS